MKWRPRDNPPVNPLQELRDIVARLRELFRSHDQRAYMAEAEHLLPHATALLVELDAGLTEKPKLAHSDARSPSSIYRSHSEGLAKAFFEEGSYIAYLADGGYSRVVVDVWDSGKVWLTSESLPKVKANWAKLEAKQNPLTNAARSLQQAGGDMRYALKALAEQLNEMPEVLFFWRQRTQFTVDAASLSDRERRGRTGILPVPGRPSSIVAILVNGLAVEISFLKRSGARGRPVFRAELAVVMPPLYGPERYHEYVIAFADELGPEFSQWVPAHFFITCEGSLGKISLYILDLARAVGLGAGWLERFPSLAARAARQLERRRMIEETEQLLSEAEREQGEEAEDAPAFPRLPWEP